MNLIDLKDERGWQLQTHQIRPLLGLDPNRLKADDYDRDGQMLGDTLVYVLSRAKAKAMNPKTRKPHRIIAVCKHCGQHVPAGKLQQHIRVHEVA